MNKPLRVNVVRALGAALALLLPGCGGPAATTPTTLVAAPPGPADLGPATGLATPPPGAVVFDLKYRAQTGVPEDIAYNSYWGYGGDDEETKTNAFLQAVRQKASSLHYVCNYNLTGRKWAAVELHGRQARALYFDLNADGKLSDNERIVPTRKVDRGVEFITPDFVQAVKGGGGALCRVLLQVSFEAGESVPNCMWSPAALMESAGTLNGRPARLVLFAAGPGEGFDRYGNSSYALLLGDQAELVPGRYVPRETLSSLILSDGQFYHLSFDGRYSNGLPARVVLVKDASPTGWLAVKLVGSNALQASLFSLDLRGAEDKTVVMRVGASKAGRVTLPVGAYLLRTGGMTYGVSNRQDWQVSFTEGPRATVKAGQVIEQALGQPTLAIRAVNEMDRYNSKTAGSATFKQGTRIYLEPMILGQGGEIFSGFRQGAEARGQKTARPPRITITGPDGKELLSKVMEYG